MNRINLIPRPLRLARQKRVRLRVWAGIVAGYTVAAVLACVLFQSISAPHDPSALDEELAALEAEAVELQTEQQRLLPKLQEQRLILAAGRSIADQPDWSLMMNYLADEVLGARVVLSGCTLSPEAGGEPGVEFNDRPIALTLSGFAQTTPDVSRFILRLEQMELFDKVTLTRTNREPFLEDQAIAFEVHCVIHPDGGVS